LLINVGTKSQQQKIKYKRLLHFCTYEIKAIAAHIERFSKRYILQLTAWRQTLALFVTHSVFLYMAERLAAGRTQLVGAKRVTVSAACSGQQQQQQHHCTSVATVGAERETVIAACSGQQQQQQQQQQHCTSVTTVNNDILCTCCSV
jgi:hypothetical protein